MNTGNWAGMRSRRIKRLANNQKINGDDLLFLFEIF